METKTINFTDRSPLGNLRRTLLSCILWENNFYLDGKSISNILTTQLSEVPVEQACSLIDEARNKHNLRSAPIFLLSKMISLPSFKPVVKNLIPKVIHNPIDAEKLLTYYWENEKRPIPSTVPKCVKQGLSTCLNKFSEYQFAKYLNHKPISSRDLLRLTHPSPKNEIQAKIFQETVKKTIKEAETWEQRLSSGQNKKEVFETMLRDNDLGIVALVKNLRNILNSGVSKDLVTSKLLEAKTEKLLPYQFIQASKYVPEMQSTLEQVMIKNLQGLEKLPGKTIILIDVSGSMESPVNKDSELNRLDCASAVAILLSQVCESLVVFTFSDYIKEVVKANPFQLMKNISSSQPHNGTRLKKAIQDINTLDYDRLIIITDEESQDGITTAKVSKAYLLNVVGHTNTTTKNQENWVSYKDWIHIEGFSQNVVNYVLGLDKLF